jgi:hypothetical protein
MVVRIGGHVYFKVGLSVAMMTSIQKGQLMVTVQQFVVHDTYQLTEHWLAPTSYDAMW